MIAGSLQPSSLFCAAVVASAHGVRGNVKVKCFLENPHHLKDYSPLSNEKGEAVYKIKKILSQDKNTLIVAFDGIVDRNEAERLKGAKLMLPWDRLPELSEDTFYYKDLIGLSAVSCQGEILGGVHALHNFGAGEILEIETPAGKLHMIPFTKECVPDINLKEGKLLLSTEGQSFLLGGPDDS